MNQNILNAGKYRFDCITGQFSQNRLSFTDSTSHSLCQECMGKFAG